MRVVKALNNNMILARQDNGQELICQGKGIVERYRKGVQLENPMFWDVKRVYPKEFQVGKYACALQGPRRNGRGRGRV